MYLVGEPSETQRAGEVGRAGDTAPGGSGTGQRYPGVAEAGDYAPHNPPIQRPMRAEGKSVMFGKYSGEEMERRDTIERLRRVYSLLREGGKFTSADAVLCAMTEIEAHRAQIVGGDVGLREVIASYFDYEWCEKIHLWEEIALRAIGRDPDAPECGADCGTASAAPDNLEPPQTLT